MAICIGIRREDKNEWERRTPLTPTEVRTLTDKGYRFIVQPQANRAFSDEEFRTAGAVIDDDLSPCDDILAVKEIPAQLLLPKKTYLFFSHTNKGQPQNMAMLRRLLELSCTLIDYEFIVDETGRRLVFFGYYAGIAGMIETLYALGRRLMGENLLTPFAEIEQPYRYASIDAMKAHLRRIGDVIRERSLPPQLRPLVCGFVGYGNVSRGAQEMLDLLPVVEVTPEQLPNLPAGNGRVLYKTVFHERHTLQPVDERSFDLNDYRKNPQHYRTAFARYLPYLTLLVNGVYWDDRYPRLLTKIDLQRQWPNTPLRVIGDISCDVTGAVEMTARTTTPSAPFFVYDPLQNRVDSDPQAPGVAVMAVDNLPGEVAREASAAFSSALAPWLPALLTADLTGDWPSCNLPSALKQAVMVFHGRLTPNFAYLQKYLSM